MRTVRLPTHEADPAARTEARRQQRIHTAHRAGWDQLERRHLAFGRFGIVTDERDGTVYRFNRGEIDAQFSPIAAYFVNESGDAIFLERAKR